MSLEYSLQVLTIYIITMQKKIMLLLTDVKRTLHVIHLGYFSKIQEIMNVNRRITCYDKMDEYGQLCAFY